MKKFQDFAARNKKKLIAGALIVAGVIVLVICLTLKLDGNRRENIKQPVQITGQISEDASENEQTQTGQKEKAKAKAQESSEDSEKAEDKTSAQTEEKGAGEKKSSDAQKSVSEKSSGQQSAGASKSGSEKSKSSEKSKGSEVSKSSESAKGSSQQSSKPSHQHSWKAHKVWVPKMVTVVDEPEHVVYGAQLYTKQADGTWVGNGKTYWFENGFTQDDLKAILKDKIKNEGYIGNYVNRQKTVPAVTHTEDRGSYQTDYYYCSCGSTKK